MGTIPAHYSQCRPRPSMDIVESSPRDPFPAPRLHASIGILNSQVTILHLECINDFSIIYVRVSSQLILSHQSYI